MPINQWGSSADYNVQIFLWTLPEKGPEDYTCTYSPLLGILLWLNTQNIFYWYEFVFFLCWINEKFSEIIKYINSFLLYLETIQ
jgi:hypothetical protein